MVIARIVDSLACDEIGMIAVFIVKASIEVTIYT